MRKDLGGPWCRATDQHGTSLIEVMLAAVLGALVVGASFDLFLIHQRHFLLQRTKTDLQQDIRGGVQLLAGELRLAGTASPDQSPLTTTMTDEVAFRANVNDVRGRLTASSAAGQNVVQVQPHAGWSKGKTVVVWGPLGWEEHVLAKDGTSGRLTFSDPLGQALPAGSLVEVVNRVRYYFNRNDPQNGKLMREIDHGANPLVEHVEALSFSYLNASGAAADHSKDIRLIRLHLRTIGADGRGGRISRSFSGELGVRL